MSNALVRQDDVFGQAFGQASLVRDALQELLDEEVLVDLLTMAEPVLMRVAKRYGLDMAKPRGIAQAQAYFVLMLNLALDRATGGDVGKAARALQNAENMPKLLVVAERLLDEPRTAIDACLKKNGLRVQEWDGSSVFELLSASVRDQLAYWSRMGLLQDNGWPPSTMAARAVCLERVERAQLEVTTGRKVDWRRVLNVDPEAAFARAYFARANVHHPAAAGGLWRPFLCSLYINAMVHEAWHAARPIRAYDQANFILADEIRRRVFVDPNTLRLFVERVVIDPEELADHYVETTARVAQTLMGMQGGEAVFAEALDTQDVHRIATSAEQLLRELARNAYNFYLSVKDVGVASEEELERFWNVRVLLSSRLRAETRFAQTTAIAQEPWKRLLTVRSIEELAAIVGGFVRWPTAQQDAFFDRASAWRRLFIRQTILSESREGAGFIRVLSAMATAETAERFLEAIPWHEAHQTVFMDAAFSRIEERETADPWFGRAFGRAVAGGYAVGASQEIFAVLRASAAFKEALVVASANWHTDADWRRYFRPGAFLHYAGRVAVAWEVMPPERRPLLVELTDGGSLGAVLTSLSEREARAFVVRLNAWVVTREQRRHAVLAWTSREGHGLEAALQEKWPRTDWRALFTIQASG